MVFDRIKTPYGYVFLESAKTCITGLAFSGGVESTLLLYMLCSRGQAPDRVFHVKVKTGEQPLRAQRIVEWMNARFDLQLVLEPMDRFGDTHYLGPDVAGLSKLVDRLYVARNAQAPLDSDYAGMRSEGKPYPRPNYFPPRAKSHIEYPFVTFDKRMPLAMFEQLGIMDLYSMTWSCDENDVAEHCGNCFSCSDRVWAERHVFGTSKTV